MNKQIITFTANEQGLTRSGGECHYSSNKVAYIEAHFELGANWGGFDSVRAVWFTDFVKGISTVLDSDGVCVVPAEVLKRKCKVNVNLVGSIVEDDELTDRLTSYPVVALVVDADAKVDGTETAPITPSQFEQFVAIVHDEVEEVTGMTAEAETLPAGSDATATYSDGVLTLGIPRGEQGEAGQDGRDGRDGRDGADGQDGADGFSPVVTVTQITGGHEVSIEDATQTQTFDVMDGTTPVIPWDDILPQDTASGSIASFPDGTDLLPAKSLSVSLAPIQDLHGYDKPWSGGNGKNKLTTTEYSGAFYNKPIGTDLKGTGGTASYTQVGNTISVTAESSWQGVVFATQPLKAGTYHINATANGSANRGMAYVTDANLIVTSVIGAFYSADLNATIADGERIVLFFGVSEATTVTWTDSQVEAGSAYTSWTPYSNECPISGRTEVVTRTNDGNFWDEEWEVGGINDTTGEKASASSQFRSVDYIPCLPSTTYYICYNGTATGAVYIYGYAEDKTFIGRLTNGGNNVANKTITTQSNCHYLMIKAQISGQSTGVYNHDISINYPSTDHEYHAYDGDTYTTTLGRTVYGAEVEQVGGQLTDRRVMIDMSTLNWTLSTLDRWKAVLPSGAKYPSATSEKTTAISSTLEAVSMTTLNSSTSVMGIAFYNAIDGIFARNGSTTEPPTGQLCYELATPQTYQLTPTEVELLHGTNNVWSDGEVEVDYYADIQLYIDKKLGQ